MARKASSRSSGMCSRCSDRKFAITSGSVAIFLVEVHYMGGMRKRSELLELGFRILSTNHQSSLVVADLGATSSIIGSQSALRCLLARRTAIHPTGLLPGYWKTFNVTL